MILQKVVKIGVGPVISMCKICSSGTFWLTLSLTGKPTLSRSNLLLPLHANISAVSSIVRVDLAQLPTTVFGN
ncbi:24900_t:CDS:2 [Racocetra persica]|uniref:24900_t:CDS:1 n=1 Tax=Racocetra persica TaxID=160502 RepID=A0ACA9RCE0_9GLOM|nr:24900_t:CDS:2 [Racocetra persica]